VKRIAYSVRFVAFRGFGTKSDALMSMEKL
jgi:hypothetical protein